MKLCHCKKQRAGPHSLLSATLNLLALCFKFFSPLHFFFILSHHLSLKKKTAFTVKIILDNEIVRSKTRLKLSLCSEENSICVLERGLNPFALSPTFMAGV